MNDLILYAWIYKNTVYSEIHTIAKYYGTHIINIIITHILVSCNVPLPCMVLTRSVQGVWLRVHCYT